MAPVSRETIVPTDPYAMTRAARGVGRLVPGGWSSLTADMGRGAAQRQDAAAHVRGRLARPREGGRWWAVRRCTKRPIIPMHAGFPCTCSAPRCRSHRTPRGPQSIAHQFGVTDEQLVDIGMDHSRWHVAQIFCDRRSQRSPLAVDGDPHIGRAR